ncbi:MAG: hypothetical protein F4W91_22870 [Gemmatimonadetes bacterium]|nr:hypothetical protein [Gemmatimonadota bacterium]
MATLPEETQGLWEMCLSDIWLPSSLAEWRKKVDAPWEVPTKEALFVNLPEAENKELTDTFGFPTIDLPDFPPIEWVNQKLPECFNTLCTDDSKLLRQSQLVQTVTERISYTLPDIVVFLVLDGLSLYDVADWAFPESWNLMCEPCFVDGLSVTTSGMRRLIGSPPLTHQLFTLGYMQRFGFSYWERSKNQLTNVLFSEFPPSQLFRITTFEEILDRLQNTDLPNRTFIQIVRTGLDGVCHSHREKPNIDAMLSQLKLDIEQIVEAVDSSQKTVRVFITSDHGILWFTRQKVMPFQSGSTSARYTYSQSSPDTSRITIAESGESVTVLTGDEVIARKRKVTEWGFHGGISAQESFVPLFDITPK